MATTDCLYSTVRCKVNSAYPTYFGMLPLHGARLAYNAELNIFGDVREAVRQAHTLRHVKSLEAAITAGALEIIKTPAPIMFDEEDEDKTPKQLVFVDGALGLEDPCWVEYS